MERHYFELEELHITEPIAFLCIVLILLLVPSRELVESES